MKKNNYNNEKMNEYLDEQVENEVTDDSSKSLKKILKRLREDKIYKSKVELMGYLVFIVVLVIIINISNIGKNYDYDSTQTNTSTAVNEKENEEENISLLKSISSNYNYSVSLNVKRIKEDKTEDSINFSYSGSSYEENMIINKIFNGNMVTYYKATDEYYIKNGDEYDLVDNRDIYDVIDAKYIEFSGLKNLIDKSSLDHFTNYSSGKQEYVYNLKIRDIVNSYKKDDSIEINIIEENNILNVYVDYTKLFKLLNEKIIEGKVNYKYENINKVEKIVIFDEDINTNKIKN